MHPKVMYNLWKAGPGLQRYNIKEEYEKLKRTKKICKLKSKMQISLLNWKILLKKLKVITNVVRLVTLEILVMKSLEMKTYN